MSRSSFPLALLLLSACCTTIWADPLFDFTLVGDGHTFAFSLPNPPTITENPHALQVSLNAPGTVDGAAGYSLSFAIFVYTGGYSGADFTFDVTPLPSGAPPNPYGGGYDYNLYGPLVTTLVSDQPNPIPPTGYPDDLLTYAFVPGEYSFTGFGDAGDTYQPYTLDITEEAAVTTTPEPSALLLFGSGALALAAVARRRLRS